MTRLRQGDVRWAWLDPTVGREQAGRRPVVLVSSDAYLDVINTLAVIVPVSRSDRGWPNHVRIAGIPSLPDCFAMTEQPRTLSRNRLGDQIGRVDDGCLTEIQRWLADHLGL